MKSLLKPDLILYAITAFLVIFVLWAKFSELDEVTIGQGTVIATSKVQVVQNLEGGMIKDILIKTGERVTKGQLLIKLDAKRFTGELKSAEQKIDSLIETITLLTLNLSCKGFKARTNWIVEQFALAIIFLFL